MSEEIKKERAEIRPPMGRHGGPAGFAGRPVEKAKDFKGTFIRLAGYLKPQKFKLIVIFIFAILGTVFNIFGPKTLGKATTKIFEGIMSKKALADLLAAQDKLTKLAADPATATPKVLDSLNQVKAGIAKIMSTNGGKIDFH